MKINDAMATDVITKLPSLHQLIGTDSWEVERVRLDAVYQPIMDAKKRRVCGYAVISETPIHMLGRTMLTRYGSRMTIGSSPFHVKIFATRDGEPFGASPRDTAHANWDTALAYARNALAQQGKRYARKFAR